MLSTCGLSLYESQSTYPADYNIVLDDRDTKSRMSQTQCKLYS